MPEGTVTGTGSSLGAGTPGLKHAARPMPQKKSAILQLGPNQAETRALDPLATPLPVAAPFRENTTAQMQAALLVETKSAARQEEMQRAALKRDKGILA